MNSGLNDNNSTLVAAFRAALLHQGLYVLLIFAILAVAWVSAREWLRPARKPRPTTPEPAWRELLRISFGVIWIFDGLLQAQPDMPAGLPSQVIEPTAASSPIWVQHVVNWAGATWSYHPIQASASAVWIQLGIGVWLIAAPRGTWSRLAGLASVAWGLVVWVFGEAFGGIFAPGLTWLFGAPGAALFYCAAGALIALPERAWRSPRLGRLVLSGMGLFFIGMAVLQAWPGRGFWQGRLHGAQGTLTSMVTSMATTPQPSFISRVVASFGSFTDAHGFAVNLFAVIALAAIGSGLLSAALPEVGLRAPAPWLIRATVIAVIVLCLADWVLIEDFGFFGGLGTDPNSMIPMALVIVAGYLALRPAPAPVAETAAAPEPSEPATAAAEPAAAPRREGWQSQPARLARAFGAAGTGVVVAIWAIAIVILGAAPMALAQANNNASPIIAQAIDGNAAPLDFKAPAFTLTDQNGKQVSLASLRGKVVLLTFLDPVCTNDCPEIAQEFKGADQVLGAKARDVELVAIVANPLYHSVAYTRAFDTQERLANVPNWLYLTGNLAQLRQAWKNYAIAAQILPSGGMIAHTDVAYVIDRSGYTRNELDFDPGPGSASSESSFSVELTQTAEQLLRSS
ncbi:MAG TPA: SCO family protein [Streptosporangiaceae bacterium]|nr:SCO family protein [Streptosporangiaceae bacterium]